MRPKKPNTQPSEESPQAQEKVVCLFILKNLMNKTPFSGNKEVKSEFSESTLCKSFGHSQSNAQGEDFYSNIFTEEEV